MPLEPCRVLRADERDVQHGAQGFPITKGIKGMGVDDLRRAAGAVGTQDAPHFAQKNEIRQMKPHRLRMDKVFRHIAAYSLFGLRALFPVGIAGEHRNTVAERSKRLRLLAEERAVHRVLPRAVPGRQDQYMHKRSSGLSLQT